MRKKVFFSIVFFAISVSIFSGAVFLPWGGSLVNLGIRMGVDSLADVSAMTGSVSGNPFSGYRIDGFLLSDKDGAALISADSLRFSVDLRALFRRKVRIVDAFVDGVRLNEKGVVGIRLKESDEPVPVELGLLTVSDISPMTSGDWKISTATLSQDENRWGCSVSGDWRGTPLSCSIGILAESGSLSVEEGLFRSMGGGGVFSGALLPRLNISGDLSGLSLERAGEAFPDLAGVVHGEIGLDWRVSGDISSPVASGHIRLDRGGLGHFEIPGLRGGWRFQGSTLKLSDWRGSASGSAISGDMSINFRDPLSISARLEASDLNLKSWFGDDPRAKGISGSIGSIVLDIKGPLGGLRGSLTLDGGDVACSGTRFSDLRGKIATADGRRMSMDMTASALGGSARLSGSCGMSGKSLDLTLIVKEMGIFDKMAMGDKISGSVNGQVGISGSLASPSLSGTLTSEGINAWGAALGKVSAAFSYGRQLLELSSVSASIGKGKIQGAGSVGFKRGPEISLKGAFSDLTGDFLIRTFPAIAGFDPKGSLSGNWSYSSSGKGPGSAELNVSSPSLGLAGAFPLKGFKASVSLYGETVNVKELSAGLYGGRLSLSGTAPIASSGVMDINGQISSVDGGQLLKTMGGIEGKGAIEGKIRISGPLASPALDLRVLSEKLDLGSVALEGLALSLKTEKDRLVSSLKGTLGGFPLTGGGWVKLPSGKNKGAVDLEAAVEGLDIRSLVPKEIKMGGTLSAKLHLLGPLGGTKLYAKGTAPRLQVGNMSFASVDLGGYLGVGETVSLEGSSQFGDRRIQVSCDLAPTKNGWGMGFSASGKDVALAALASGLEGVVDGRVNLDVDGRWAGGALKASGKASSTELSAQGIRVGAVSLPLSINGHNLTVKDGRARVYGGSGTIDLDVDLTKNVWKGRAEVKSADLGALVKDGADLPGSMTGSVDLRLDMSGIAGRAFLMDFSGFLKGRSMELSDFAVLQNVTKGKPLKIRDLSANFNIDGRDLYILPGSRASAWPGDEVFRYLEVSGTVSSGKAEALNLSCGGEINLNALNAFLGAMRSVFKATIENVKDPRSLATDLLAGFIGGYSSQEFREIRLHLGGNWESPVISKLRISEKQSVGGGLDELPSSNGEPKIRIKIDIPTGEGGGSEVEAGDQVKQQIMENLLKQVVGGSDQ